ncbi:hypothetical protein M514_27430 [Trichuris suis]|uniref:Uncharacterized protein n=1 Tax=Trichuris suis TaxID=68888 RepID=A0A085MT38_9BILA|nr:hypothetical protein M514_27430 [Trichuris suis]
MPEELWREVRNIVQEAAMRTQGNKSKKATWLSQEAPRMAQERREAKVKRERERFAQLNAEFQRIARRDRRVLLEEQCREVEDNSRIEVTSSSVGATSIAASINALDAVLWISSSWNKLQPEATRKCFRRAGFVRDQEDDVELCPDGLTREAEIEGVDFEDFVAIDDEVATSTEPDPQAVYQSILAEAGMSVEASSAGDDAEEESDDETEMVQKLKEEDVGRMLAQLRCFAAEKCPEMLSRVASAEAALTAYVCSKNKQQTRTDTFSGSILAPENPYA